MLLRNEPRRWGAGPAAARRTRLRRVVVLGRLADVDNTGDRGSSNVRPPYVVTPLEGLRAALEPLGVEVEAGQDPRPRRAAAAGADVAIVIAGYTAEDEGEGFGGRVPAGRGPAAAARRARRSRRRASGCARAGWARTTAPVGRGGDRRSLTLRDEDEELILAVAAGQPADRSSRWSAAAR